MPRDVVTAGDVATTPAYSHAVRARGALLFASGQVARDDAGNLVGEGDPVAQAEQAFENLRRVLAAAGATFDDVIKVTLFVTDRSARQALADARTKFFSEPRPAATFLIVDGLADPACLVEVEAIANVG